MTNSGNPITVREMELSDIGHLMKLKDAEGWNQTEKDWELLIMYEESVNRVALQDDRIAGSITAIKYNSSVAWIGMMLVEKNYRGRGISKLLLNEVIHKLNNCSSIKLDATPAGRPLYLKLGFIYEYTLYRMTNMSVSDASLNMQSVETVKIRPEDLPEVAEFDKIVFGADRTELIKHLYVNDPELAWLIRDNNRTAGFIMGRKGSDYTQIGPLYATSQKGAKALIRSALGQLSGKAVVVDVHANKPAIIQWFEGVGFTSQRPFDRMYLKHNPNPGSVDTQYLIAGPELG